MPPATAAPQVRDLGTLIDQQNAALQPQYDLLDQSENTNEQSGQAQLQGLDAAKTNAFAGIGQDASNKGMAFSGFTPDSEAKYVGATYMPAVAQLAGTIANARTSLLTQKAQLGKSAFDTANSEHDADLKTLDDWNTLTQQEQFQASEQDKANAFTAQQNVLNRNAAAAGISPADKLSADIGAASAFLQPKEGSDNKVSPATYAQAKAIWVGEGYSPASFDTQFASYRNPANKSYKLG